MVNLIFNHWSAYAYLFWLLVIVVGNIWLGFANSSPTESVPRASPADGKRDDEQTASSRQDQPMRRPRRREPVKEKVNV
jgi:hypothetical protein